MQILKADPARFSAIPDYPFAENWVEIDLGEGYTGQMHYIDEGEGETSLAFNGAGIVISWRAKLELSVSQNDPDPG